MAFGRGSLSGSNGHGLWLTCSKCSSRVMYCPRHGAKATSRSAGPLGQDVKEKIADAMGGYITPNQLQTKAVGLEAAEKSALRLVEKIQKERQQLAEKEASKEKTGGTPTPPRKDQKRNPDTPAEIHEKKEKEAQDSKSWHYVAP